VKPLLIIKAGEKLSTLQHVAGDFEDWILEGMGWPRANSIIVSVYKNETLPDVNTISGIVITGSPAMVTDKEQWIERTASWLKNVVRTKLPVLGICFGHQLLAYSLGGVVSDNSKGIEVGSVNMTLLETERDALFFGLADNLNVQVSHQQSVVSLPAGVHLLAKTELDEHHAFRFGETAWGIQFHPEFNKTIVDKYVEYYQAETGDNLKINKTIETPQAALILQKFSKLLK